MQRKHMLFFNKYHPIEINPDIPLKDKKKAMEEWWKSHIKLMIESGLSKSDLEDIIKNGPLKFREGVFEFLDILYKNSIPLVIISASGCGDAIPMFFEKYNKNYSNIYYITNFFNWEKNGKAVSFKGPIIHSMNKDEEVIKRFPKIYLKIKNRRNVVLLGDNVEDILMIHGFNYKNLLKIGFLNNEVKE
jgi:5'-nucleotidase